MTFLQELQEMGKDIAVENEHESQSRAAAVIVQILVERARAVRSSKS
jgi:hypothetical protein